MRIWTRPLMGMRLGSIELVDAGQDEVMVDDGLRVGYVSREPNASICLIGHPSAELQLAIADHFGTERRITFPSVILDKHQNPIVYGEEREDDE